jgi:hypothetical protein
MVFVLYNKMPLVICDKLSCVAIHVWGNNAAAFTGFKRLICSRQKQWSDQNYSLPKTGGLSFVLLPAILRYSRVLFECLVSYKLVIPKNGAVPFRDETVLPKNLWIDYNDFGLLTRKEVYLPKEPFAVEIR